MKSNWLKNIIYLVISTICISLSVFNFGTSVWMAAWIGPIFLIRFIRNNRWLISVLLSFVILQISFMIGMIPFGDDVGPAFQLTFIELIVMQAESGLLFLVPVILVPFLLDKALYKRLPKGLATLIYPLTVVALEYLTALRTGTFNTFGETQFTSQHISLWASIAGIYGISFIICWAASMFNLLWENKWNIKSMGKIGLLFSITLSVLLLFSGFQLAYPLEAKGEVPIAGVIPESELIETVMETGLPVRELVVLAPEEYAEYLNSSNDRLEELKIRTVESIEKGAKIIIWPEFSFRLISKKADVYIETLREIAKEHKVYLVISYARILDKDERKDKPELNMSICITPNGETAWEYAKTYPNPGLETNIVQSGFGDIPYVDTPYGRIGEVICADTIFPHFIKQAADKDIDILLNPSWDGKAFGLKIGYISALRAVENGFTMVRVSSGGLTAVIDPQFTQWAKYDGMIEEKTDFYAKVPVISGNTIYGKVGYLFPILCIIGLIFIALLYIVLRDKK